MKNGYTFSEDDFFKEMEQKELDDCETDEEREYIFLKREFEEKTEEFRKSYIQKMIEKNHKKIMEMIKKSFN